MNRDAPDGFLHRVATTLYRVENAFYVVIAVALAVAGAALFGDTLYQFVVAVSEGSPDLKAALLDVLDGLLLVFIVAELLHTVRAVIGEATLRPEPFLVVGIVAVIRRLIVISAEASEFLGGPRFLDLMLEMGVLVGAALGLGATIFLLGRSRGDDEPATPGEPSVRDADRTGADGAPTDAGAEPTTSGADAPSRQDPRG